MLRLYRDRLRSPLASRTLSVSLSNCNYFYTFTLLFTPTFLVKFCWTLEKIKKGRYGGVSRHCVVLSISLLGVFLIVDAFFLLKRGETDTGKGNSSW